MDVAAAVERAKHEINEDIRTGAVPARIGSFERLHDFVDANEYGGLCEADIYRDEKFINTVQEQIDEWLRGGRDVTTDDTPQIRITPQEAEAIGAALDFFDASYDADNVVQAQIVAGLASLAVRATTGDHSLDLDLYARGQRVAEGEEETP
jgi:hypothetical protein